MRAIDAGMRLEASPRARELTNPTASQYIRGALSGIAAVSIWAGWIVAARFGVTTSLTPWDIAALRFSVAGMILMPVLVQKGFALDRLGWTGLVAIVVGGGAPMVLVANAGLLFAPAAHAGALFPGVMPLMVAILASIVLKEQFSAARRIGLLLILVGSWRFLASPERGLVRRKMSAMRSSWRPQFYGPSTRLRCDAQVSMAPTRPRSQPEHR